MVGAVPSWTAPALATDGAALWSDWLPMAGGFGLDVEGSHYLNWVLWVLLSVGVFALARSLGASALASAAVAGLLAAHPTGVAAYGDLAGRGPLMACVAMVFALTISLRPRSSSPRGRFATWAAVAVATAVALLAHPVAAVLPVPTALALWRRLERPRPSWSVWLQSASCLTVQLATVGVWMVARMAMDIPDAGFHETHVALGPDGEMLVADGLTLAMRGLYVSLLGAPLLPHPWDVVAPSMGWSTWTAWAGAAVLVGLPIVARRLGSEGVAVGLWWTWAVLLGLSQLAEPLPSAQAPALLTMLLIGPLLAFAPGIRSPRLAGAVLVGSVILALGPTRWNAAHVNSELAWREHAVATLPDSSAPRAALARFHLREGKPRRALDVVGDDRSPSLAAIAVEAHLALRQWGTARRVLPHVEGAKAVLLRCAVASASEDVTAVRHCEQARRDLGDSPEILVSLARALERARLTKQAETLLREALAESPSEAMLHDALVSVLDRAGWMREAVVALEAWYALPDAPTMVRGRLVAALERKGRGDILQRRNEEAAQALERALEVDPAAHRIRFSLAEAYDALGRTEDGANQRAQAKAHGATPPPRPGAVRPGGGRRLPLVPPGPARTP